VSHCRSVAQNSGGDKSYSHDEFESSADQAPIQPATSEPPSISKVQSSAAAAPKPAGTDHTVSVQRDKDHLHAKDEEPVVSHTHSGNWIYFSMVIIITACLVTCLLVTYLFAALVEKYSTNTK